MRRDVFAMSGGRFQQQNPALRLARYSIATHAICLDVCSLANVFRPEVGLFSLEPFHQRDASRVVEHDDFDAL